MLIYLSVKISWNTQNSHSKSTYLGDADEFFVESIVLHIEILLVAFPVVGKLVWLLIPLVYVEVASSIIHK